VKVHPEISLVVATFNELEYLPAAFQSILDQTIDFRRLDIVLVDCCSGDGSGELADSYAARYDNVRSIRLGRPSAGAGLTRNTGIDAARAPYLMFLDADDAFLPGACETFLHAISRGDSDVASGRLVQVGPDSSFVPPVYDDLAPEPLVCGSVEECPALLALPPSVVTRIYRRDFLVESCIRFPEDINLEDGPFAAEVLLRARGIQQLTDVVYEYRVRDDPARPSATQRLSPSFFIDYAETRRIVMRLFERYSSLDYFYVRYRTDFQYIITALARAGARFREGRQASFEALRWFFRLRHRAELFDINPTFLAIAAAIADGVDEEASELLDLVAEIERVRKGMVRGRSS